MIRLSKHTADEMDERRIRLSYIEAALAMPERVEPDPIDPTLTRSWRSIPEFGGRYLRVVHRAEDTDVFVGDGALGSRSRPVIRTNYDPEADVLHVRFGRENAQYDSAQEVAPGLYIEYDTDGNVIGVEVTSAKLRAEGRQLDTAQAAA